MLKTLVRRARGHLVTLISVLMLTRQRGRVVSAPDLIFRDPCSSPALTTRGIRYVTSTRIREAKSYYRRKKICIWKYVDISEYAAWILILPNTFLVHTLRNLNGTLSNSPCQFNTFFRFPLVVTRCSRLCQIPSLDKIEITVVYKKIKKASSISKDYLSPRYFVIPISF